VKKNLQLLLSISLLLRFSIYNFYEARQLRLQLSSAYLLFEKALERSHYYLRTLDLERCLALLLVL
jgi:hypothetical protein